MLLSAMPMWLASDPLIVASRSAARQALLEAAGVELAVAPADIDERGLEDRMGPQAPDAVALLLAREKAAVVARLNPGRLVLGADQVLALGEQRFAKPADRAAAKAQLLGLRGRSHELHSAIVFMADGVVLFEHVGVARLTMRGFSERFLELYLDTVGAAATASVGAYQLEGLGVQLFERIEGDYFTVLGLPLLPALEFLRRRGCLAS
jgi:septum formation protein